MILCIDFDGTIVDHQFPDIGEPVPGAFTWLKKFQEAGAKLILWTMRSDEQKDSPVLAQAVDFCNVNGLNFWGVNKNHTQHTWSHSPKCYAHYYIDDAAVGCPLKKNPNGGKPYVDWEIVGPMIMELLKQDKKDK